MSEGITGIPAGGLMLQGISRDNPRTGTTQGVVWPVLIAIFVVLFPKSIATVFPADEKACILVLHDLDRVSL
jgi:hypothetical protein